MTAAATSSLSGMDAKTPQAGSAMRWLNVLPHLDPKYGGMSSAVPALSAAVAAKGAHPVSIAGFCAPEEQHLPSGTPELELHRLTAGYANWFRDEATRRKFAQLVADAAGIHIHGLWEQSTLLAARAARKTAKPFIISAHGMLQPWALHNKRWKKIIYSALIERSNLQQAACLHALTRAEAEDYRAYGLKNPIAIVPNGVDIPTQRGPQLFLDTFPELRGKRLVLFLSRIHFKKGLDLLCQVWTSSKRWPDTQLVLAGPDFENTRASLEALIASAGMQDRVTFTGMLDAPLKWSALSAADCFVLPSYSEGLSVSVLEAMGMGLPVIVTRQCNLPEVAAHACGWEIEPTVAALEHALDECLGASSAARIEMGSRGQALVKDRYSWPMVGQQMSDVYSWLQGGPLPLQVEVMMGNKA